MTDHSVIGAGGEEVGVQRGLEIGEKNRVTKMSKEQDIQEEGSLVTVRIPLKINMRKN